MGSSASVSGPPQLSVRPASVADSASIANVCLLTTFQGRRTDSIVYHSELPAEVRALPYLHLPSGFCFVLVETREVGWDSGVSVPALPVLDSDSSTTDSDSGTATATPYRLRTGPRQTRNIVGYVVGTAESSQFAAEVEASWWPKLRLKYPGDLVGTPVDRYFVDLIHKNTSGIAGIQRVSESTHIHVSVLSKYKKYGCDRLLLDVALRHIRRRKR